MDKSTFRLRSQNAINTHDFFIGFHTLVEERLISLLLPKLMRSLSIKIYSIPGERKSSRGVPEEAGSQVLGGTVGRDRLRDARRRR